MEPSATDPADLGQMTLALAILAVVNLDFVWTTLSLARAGPLAGPVTRWAGRGLRALGRAVPPGMTGPLVLCLMSATWLAGLWLGWALLFSADSGSVVDSHSQTPATLLEKVYYVGFALTTLGVGDYEAEGTAWRLLTVVASANGLIVITLGITYFVSVFSAIIQERTLAKQVRLSGDLPEDALLWGWDGRGFGRLIGLIQQLTPDLLRMAESVKAFPVIREYRTRHPWSSAGAAVVMLTDLLAAIDLCQERPDSPACLDLMPLARALDVLLEEVAPGVAAGARPLDLERLRAAGLPVVAEAAVAARLKRHDQRRRRAVAFALQRGVAPPPRAADGSALPGDREGEA